MNANALVDQLSAPDLPPHRAYQRLFVGHGSIGSLLRYELYMSLTSAAPGAAGYWLRKKAFARLLGASGRGCLFGRGVTLRNPAAIRLGNGVSIDDYVVVDAKGDTSSITTGDQVLIGRYGILSCNESSIHFGDRVSVGPFCLFASRSTIEIGSQVGIASGVHVVAGGYRVEDHSAPVTTQPRQSRGISIEDGVWIGSGARILDGVRIGANSIIGAGAVIHKDVPAGVVAVGNPARVVQKREDSS